MGLYQRDYGDGDGATLHNVSCFPVYYSFILIVMLQACVDGMWDGLSKLDKCTNTMLQNTGVEIRSRYTYAVSVVSCSKSEVLSQTDCTDAYHLQVMLHVNECLLS